MRLYIARVCGFCSGRSRVQNHKRVQYTAHNAQVWYPISDLLHLKNDVLIGYACTAQGGNLCFYENLYACVQKRELCSYIYPTLIDQSDKLAMM